MDLDYFKDMFLDSFDHLAAYYDYGISYNEEGQRMDGFYSMRDFWQKEEAKLFLKISLPTRNFWSHIYPYWILNMLRPW